MLLVVCMCIYIYIFRWSNCFCIVRFGLTLGVSALQNTLLHYITLHYIRQTGYCTLASAGLRSLTAYTLLWKSLLQWGTEDAEIKDMTPSAENPELSIVLSWIVVQPGESQKLSSFACFFCCRECLFSSNCCLLISFNFILAKSSSHMNWWLSWTIDMYDLVNSLWSDDCHEQSICVIWLSHKDMCDLIKSQRQSPQATTYSLNRGELKENLAEALLLTSLTLYR